ncbi:PREDICTED: caspase-3-like [Wasmannia auropunctata]|uniref:caspase-3-like n=1 Tax=Wasmannia auropunctata TaxID=64793 RepID=UPI0005EF5EF9|nr:PREDICTED: caspase-3-like [Wasmannia auropunctata]
MQKLLKFSLIYCSLYLLDMFQYIKNLFFSCMCKFKIYLEQILLLGTISNSLTVDGSYDSFTPVEDIRQFTNFFMFMSTIQGFLSIRHKEQGSWFIQELCKIFKTYGNQLTFHECVRKIMESLREKQGTVDGNQIAQLAEIRLDRLKSDFQLKQVASIV